MKRSLILTMLVAAHFASGQDYDNPFEAVFNGMFQVDQPDWEINTSDAPPAPPVPLDGGLTALLLAGGAAGYRQYQKKKKV